MKESEIEARLVRGVKALGGVAYKFVSPGNVGVPDRVVVLPGGRVIFVELKAEVGRLSPMQRQQLARLRRLGGGGPGGATFPGGKERNRGGPVPGGLL